MTIPAAVRRVLEAHEWMRGTEGGPGCCLCGVSVTSWHYHTGRPKDDFRSDYDRWLDHIEREIESAQ